MNPIHTRRHFLQTSLAATLAVGAGGLLAACGDDDDETSSGASSESPGTSGTSDATTTAPAELTKVTAMMPFPLYLAFFVDCAAKSGGFMADAGVDLDLQFARSAPQALQQLAAGNVDIARNAPIGLVKAVSQEDAPFVSIATVNQRIIYNLVSSNEAPVEALADLEGKKVGMATLGGNAEDTLDLVLRAAGLDPTTVAREAVGNEATSFAFIEEGRIDAVFATHEATASIRASGVDASINELTDTNPLLGTSLVTDRTKLADNRPALVKYLKGLHAAMEAVLDDAQLDELIPKVREEWDLPQLDDPDTAKPVITAIAELWLAAGRENLLVNVPERWETGVAGFAKAKIAEEGAEPTDFYTNDLIEEALR